MNKRAEAFTPITMIFLVLTFIIFMAFFGGAFLNLGIGMAMGTGYFTGIEGFIMANLGMVIFIAIIIAIIVLGVFSSQ